MQEVQPAQIDCKSGIKNLALLNVGVFIERTLEGIAAGYIVDKMGIGDDLQGLDYLGVGIITEAIIDITGLTPIVNKVADKYARFSRGRLKESLKDDVGGVAGWTLGNAIGYYIARHYL